MPAVERLEATAKSEARMQKLNDRKLSGLNLHIHSENLEWWVVLTPLMAELGFSENSKF